jgi:hypothetical protein
MKNKLFSLLLAGIATLTIQAQTDYAKLGIERKVLFTMNKNEVCTKVETRNLQKGAKDAKSEMYVEDTVKKVKTYVLNGERIKSTCVDTGYLVGSTYNDCMERDSIILEYGRYSDENDSAYISFGDKVFGPYHRTSRDANDYLSEWEEFFFCQKGEKITDGGYARYITFRHDYDGMEYRMKLGKQGRTFFQSPNRKHTVNIMGNDVYKIRLDNTSYTLDSVKPDSNHWFYNNLKNNTIAVVKVYDDGNCVIRYGLFEDSEGDFYCYGEYYIDKGKVRTIAQNQYFDFDTRTIKDIPQQPKEEYYEYHISSDYISYYGRDDDGSSNYVKDTPKDNAKIVENNLKDNRLGYNICDEKHQHRLFTVQGLGYILVDGIAVKADYPLMASYNAYANCFRWVVVEGNQVVYYSYQIP